MDIQKELLAYEQSLQDNGFFKVENIGMCTVFDPEQNKYHPSDLCDPKEYKFIDMLNVGWTAWQAAKANAVTEWIGVQDKLPEFQQEVLILVGDEYLVAEYLPSVTNEFGIQFKEGFWINGGASVVDADLWMSLPQPPKAQDPAND